MEPDVVRVEHVGAYAVLTLNRPEKRNAISTALAAQFRAALADLESCPVVVLTGAGDKAFSAGLDLSERSGQRGWSEVLGANHGQFWMECVEAMRQHPAVFIAAVNGVAVGGGLSLVNNSELAVASSTAEFGMPEFGFGSFPAQAGPTTMSRILPKHAAQLIFTAKRVDAATALSWGLVNEVVPPEDLMQRATALAEHIAGFDPVTLAFGKRTFRELDEMGWSEGFAYSAMMSALVRNTREMVRHRNDSAK